MQSILLIEDETDLAELVAFTIERDGFRCTVVHDGIEGVQAARRDPSDLVLLDLMLPGMPGTEVCRMLKSGEKTARVPVIMLTAKGEEVDKIVGFEVGADDYVVKPFSIRELLLRIKAVLRRSETDSTPDSVVSFGPVSIDSSRHRVTLAGAEALFTSTEFKLLHTLVTRAGRVQSRETLLREVWGYNHIGDTRTVDTHITRLRTKLGEAGDLIRTVRGFGYKIERQGEKE